MDDFEVELDPDLFEDEDVDLDDFDEDLFDEEFLDEEEDDDGN
jgi:hypothetical protein